MVGCNTEWQNFNTAEQGLLVDKELLSVPDIVEVFARLFGVLDTGWVTARDEVGNATVDT